MKNKNIKRIYSAPSKHWVGNGFHVHSMLSYHAQGGAEISPFLLLDYAGPTEFEPTDESRRGVEIHPHRGFETVTIVYQGEIEHSDNAGNSGKIGPGDVQWMTAARGILHEEMHGKDFTRNGGTLEMVQLWVNLPAADKMKEPRYQEILNKNIPVLDLDNDAGTLRLIAGLFNGRKGAAQTFTPINLWDMRLNSGKSVTLSVPEGHNTSLLVLSGALLADGEMFKTKELAQFDREGDRLTLDVQQDSTVLLMSGEPINEPIVGHGPFVMNTHDEIRQAVYDYSTGQF